MVYIEYELLSKEKGRVCFQMFKPDRLSEDRKQNGIMVDEIPQAEEGRGIPSLYVNPKTKEFFYEYELAPEAPMYPLNNEGKMQRQIDDLKLLMAELVAGGTV